MESWRTPTRLIWQKKAYFLNIGPPELVNSMIITVAKLSGEFVWHTHPDTDELFLVVSERSTSRCQMRCYAARRGALCRTKGCTPTSCGTRVSVLH